MKKSTKLLLFATGLTVAGIYTYNKYVEETATKKNLLSDEEGEFYEWTHGKVFYKKTGEGSPLLLIHDTNSAASSVEWKKLVHYLEKNHTVYSIELLGCGRSDKPALEYTTYLYVQMITSFVNDIIKEKVTVVTSNMSTPIVIMANHMDNNLFSKIILINPISLKQMDIIPDDLSKFKKTVVSTPFIGTFIYNIMNSTNKIDKDFRTRYYESPQLISSSIEDSYYESSHKNGSNGKYLYSSLIGNYMNNTITHVVKKMTTPTLIIGSNGITNYSHVLDSYQKNNPTIEVANIDTASLYPHMEMPEHIHSIIESYV